MIPRSKVVLGVGVLVAFSAIVHVLLGLDGLLTWVQTGELPDVLAPVFLLSGGALLAGLVGSYRGVIPTKPAYALGVGMMVVYLIGYADYHVLGVTEAILGIDAAGHSHGHHGSNTEILVDHLVDDFVALSSKAAEAIAAVLLAGLAVTES